MPHRGIGQVRVHYLLDLVIITGYTGSDPKNLSLLLDFALLDFALDTMVANQLSPGMELMGSPLGFPEVPDGFYMTSHWNMALTAEETLGLWRQLVRATLIRCIGRYGAAEVAAWNLESWNEADIGWGWPNPHTAASLTGWEHYWDASVAGVEDAEAATGVKLRFGGPAIAGGSVSNFLLDFALAHAVNGTNIYTGKPGRLDFISQHVKGGNTTYKITVGELATNDYIKSKYPAIAARRVPLYNDESDPLVGWATLQVG